MLKAAFTIIFAVLMAVSANAFLYLPFTPVPITLQVLTVIFSALMLGGPLAMASQVLYISMGLAGLPVFAGFIGGPAALLGPTGGYIIGFALAAYITGFLASGKSTGLHDRWQQICNSSCFQYFWPSGNIYYRRSSSIWISFGFIFRQVPCGNRPFSMGHGHKALYNTGSG